MLCIEVLYLAVLVTGFWSEWVLTIHSQFYFGEKENIRVPGEKLTVLFSLHCIISAKMFIACIIDILCRPF